MADLDDAPLLTVLQLRDGTFTFEASPAELVTVPRSCSERSVLLSDLADSSVDASAVEVPVASAALQLWVRHSQCACSHAFKRRRAESSHEHTPHTTGHSEADHTPQKQLEGGHCRMKRSSTSESSDLGFEDTCTLLAVRLPSLPLRTDDRAQQCST